MKIHHCKSLWASEILTSNLFFLLTISYPDTFHTVNQPFFIETSRALKPVACLYLSHPFNLTFQHGFKDKFFKVFISIGLAAQPNLEDCFHIKKKKKKAEEKKQTTLLCWQGSLKIQDYSFSCILNSLPQCDLLIEIRDSAFTWATWTTFIPFFHLKTGMIKAELATESLWVEKHL